MQTLPAADDPDVLAARPRSRSRDLVADGRVRELVIAKVDGEPVSGSRCRDALLGAGFVAGYRGYALRSSPPAATDRAWARPSGRSAPSASPSASMPEGDTLARTAAGLRPYLVGRDGGGGEGAGAGPAGRAAGRRDRHRGRGDRQEPPDPVRQRARGPDAPADARLVAPLPAGRVAGAGRRPGPARARGAGLGRGLLRCPGRRAVRAADRVAAPVALEARTGPARRSRRRRRGDPPPARHRSAPT